MRILVTGGRKASNTPTASSTIDKRGYGGLAFSNPISINSKKKLISISAPY
jgi:hypothetical protein